MPPEMVIAIGASVTGFVQLIKWTGIPNRYGPYILMACSFVGVTIWVASQPDGFIRTQLFNYFAAWVAVSISGAGIFNLIKSTPGAVSKTGMHSFDETHL